jgi:hypothetical protein
MIAFDALTEVERTATTDPQTWTHTPVGTPRAIVVSVIHGVTATTLVSSVTYGGVPMTPIVSATDTVTEPGISRLWFLGRGIPTGPQTVSVDLTSATDTDIHFTSTSYTAGTNCEIVDSDAVGEDLTSPSVTLQYLGRVCQAVAALYTGENTPSNVTVNANCTLMADWDMGAWSAVVFRQTTPGSTDFAIGVTGGPDDMALCALAFAEVTNSQFLMFF